MTNPNYYKPRLPGWLITALVVAAVLVAVVWCGRIAWSQVSEAIREDERTRVVAAADQAARIVWPSERGRWNRERDSLRREIARRDAALTQSTQKARAALTRLSYALAHPDSTPPDTVKVLVIGAVNACTAALNDCDAFRETATSQIAHDSVTHHEDSTAFVALATHYAVRGDSLDKALLLPSSMVTRGTLWKNRAAYATYGTSVGVLLCLLFCR